MNSKITLLSGICLVLLNFTATAQKCDKPIEKVLRQPGTTYTTTCENIVVMDIKTYTKYRYGKKQYGKLDSVITAYTNRIDSLDQENTRNRELLEQKVREKEGIIDQYKEHIKQSTSVLEECKANSERFTKEYEQKLQENRKLEGQVQRLKRQRKGFIGVSGGLAGALILVLLI